MSEKEFRCKNSSKLAQDTHFVIFSSLIKLLSLKETKKVIQFSIIKVHTLINFILLQLKMTSEVGQKLVRTA